MRKKLFKMSISGFTIVELLVSITIIALISGIVITNYRKGEKSSGLNAAAMKLVSDIRKVQADSMGLRKHGSSFPSGGWGLRFHRDEGYYNIFADINNNIKCDDGGGGLCDETNEQYGGNILFAKEGVAIQGRLRVYDEGSWNNRNFVFVTFVPPDPIINIYSSSNINPNSWQDEDADLLEITLGLINTTLTKKIIINRFGLVDIEG